MEGDVGGGCKVCARGGSGGGAPLHPVVLHRQMPSCVDVDCCTNCMRTQQLLLLLVLDLPSALLWGCL